MSKFRISDSGGPAIPGDDAVSRTFGIVGQRGTGKSSAAAVLVEEFVDTGGRVVVADPTGVWWGLAHAGTGPGLKNAVILGGEHQNAPLEETGGQVAADLAVGSDYSVVVLDLKLLRKAAQVRFMADFLEGLYHQNRDALHVVIDEAGRFAPQALREKGYAIRLLGAIEDVVKLGRSRGLGCTLVEQRPAHIAKSVFEQIETLVAFRLMGPNDRKALSDWIEAQGDPAREKEVMAAVSKMGTGTGLVWSPAFLDYFGIVDWRFPRTFDSRRTPKPGERRRGPGERAPVDLAALTERMAASIERAKADDPKALRAEIARLKAEAAKVTVAAPAKVVERTRLLVKDADVARLERLHERVAKKDAEAFEARRSMAAALAGLLDAAKGHMESVVKDARAVLATAPPRPRPVHAAAPARPQRATEPPAEGADSLAPTQQRILDVVAMLCVRGIPATRECVARWQGIHPNGSRYLGDLARLRERGDLEGFALTASGQAAARPLDTGLDAVYAALEEETTRKVLKVVAEADRPLSREEVAAELGIHPNGSRFLGDLAWLRTMGVIPERAPILLTEGARR